MKGKSSNKDVFAETLSRHLRASILPGDTAFTGDALKEASKFLRKSAETRSRNRSVLKVAPATGHRRLMRIAIINDDMPFLVDSIAATIAAQGLSIDRLVHPVVPVERDAKGKLVRLDGKAGAGNEKQPRESMIYIETDRLEPQQQRELERQLRETLGDVRAAVQDWPKVQSCMAKDAARLEHAENRALLTWFNDGMLTQLGHVERARDGSQSRQLGVCRKSATSLLSDESYIRAFEWFEQNSLRGHSRELLIVKANRLANVHRRVPLDLFIVPIRTGKKVTALSVHAGVWTSAALATPPQEVPRLRADLEFLADKFGFDRGGHAGKALVHALTALPHDQLIGLERDDIARIATTMMALVDRPRPRLAMAQAPLSRHLFAFVWMPRDMLSTQARLSVEAMLREGADAQLLDWSLEVEGGNLAMLRFLLDARQSRHEPDPALLEAQLQDLLRGWNEAVERHLLEYVDAQQAASLTDRYAAAFPAAYRNNNGASEGAIDIYRLHGLATNGTRARDARLFCVPSQIDGETGQLHLKIYQTGGNLLLSDVVPALENFGFRVQSEAATHLNDPALGTVHDFTLIPPAGSETASLGDRAADLEEAIAAVLNGEAENGPFNRLVVELGLSAQSTNWLRAFYRYLRQTGMGFTIYTVVDALARAPQVSQSLIDLFVARHDPDFSGDREKAADKARAHIQTGLSKVAALNDDRLLRQYHALIEAVLRTNAYAPAGQEALAFKIESAKVPGLPKPLPWREIFVYSRRVEGIHLRAGPIARGGLRWSDRRDDFRTEILGLMKAQRVKNAVIVPSGAKGGFYPKQLPSPVTDREGWAAEGQASYEVFIRTLLSVTDNLENGKVVHPERVVVQDAADPYFVVAADKGTARFSDVANRIAQEAGFWLGDAFASGGSNGYDHKAMGITARGAWVSVQRHFLEMGVDVQKDPVRVAGCGDMSGDVFGNGMLLSKAIKLVAAFDHRHIFIDPDPDPAASWKERQRLYDLPRSSWADYDEGLISKGGGVYARSAKKIKLSKAATKSLGLDTREFEPDALISAILTAPIDLIWFGGIGTYIKSAKENDIEVGDPGNDALRVNAADLRAKVVGEGANLGITQAGRIEFALQGGRINTDFIDNSAGVDCSDNEVNIKIALAAAQQGGKLSDKKRNALLEDMTDEVGEIVLEDNRLQALAISIAESGGADAVASYARLAERLEEQGALDRATEGLADNETLRRRATDGAGLARPELAVLLSCTKLVLQDAIEDSSLPDDPAMEVGLIASFPTAMRKKFVAQLRDHRLRREMIATELANRIINRMGLLTVFELAEEESVPLHYVAAAFVAADRLFDTGELWEMLDTAKVAEATRIILFERVAMAMRGQMADLLRIGAGAITPSQLASELEEGVIELMREADNLLTGEAQQHSQNMQAELVAAGAPDKIARAVTRMFDLDGTVGIARLARNSKVSATELTGAFAELGMQLGLDWAQGYAALMDPSDIWERLLVAGLARDFQHMRLDLLRSLLKSKTARANPMAAIAEWLQDNAAGVRQLKGTIQRAQNRPPVTPSALAQIASQARILLAR